MRMLGYIKCNNEYKYVGQELSARIFADVLVYLFDKNVFAPSTAVERVRGYHTSHGGKAPRKDYEHLFFYLMSGPLSGYVLRMEDRLYRMDYASDDLMFDMDVEIEEPDFDEWDGKLKISTDTCDKCIGQGTGAVYVYYYDIYKKYFTKNGGDSWPCKIGMSSGDAMKRIFAQAGTAYPEWPHVALIIKTDKPRELEALLHASLKLQNRHMEGAPGKEWFMTRPDIVERIYENNVVPYV